MQRGFRDGNGVEHNFHFTFELNTTFAYAGGEVFSFNGDDDLWVFIDGKLTVDLGGVHEVESDSVNLDTLEHRSVHFVEKTLPAASAGAMQVTMGDPT